MANGLRFLGLLGIATGLMGLAPGESAPEFTAKNQDGKQVRLADFKGSPLLIFFYPKDDTPGCTKEACLLRDEYSKFKKLGAAILGVSRQDEKSHAAFRDKFHLPFDLLADTDGKIAKQFGIGSMPVVGFYKRQSILLDGNGKVVRFYDAVDPSKHAHEVLEDLKKLQPPDSKANS
jgi:thioredoxin-dependent peroxiredoxin